jgi:1-aminocyclopropane-1-carboxylate deaminase/D-cysteine desulfhydrase-like pyridoxal-dependent ACC family enzyme
VRLIASVTGEKFSIEPGRLEIANHVYGGAYGRPLREAKEAATILQMTTGIQLDDTYSAKAWVAALDEARRAKGTTLFWLTFDARCLTN